MNETVASVQLPLNALCSIERFHHVMKNDVSVHNSVILLRMMAVLVYIWESLDYVASALTSHI